MNEIVKQAEEIIKEKEKFDNDCFFLFFWLSILVFMYNIVYFDIKDGYFRYRLLISVFLFTVPAIKHRLKIRKLKNDEEYQLAKAVMIKYKKSENEEKLKRMQEEIAVKEKNKVDRIANFKKYLIDE